MTVQMQHCLEPIIGIPSETFTQNKSSIYPLLSPFGEIAGRCPSFEYTQTLEKMALNALALKGT